MKTLPFVLVLVFACCFFVLPSSYGKLYSLNPQVGHFDDTDLREANPPADLSITIYGPVLVLSWTAVVNATNYKVESSDTSSGGFTDASVSGTFYIQGATRTWASPANAAHKFYRVRSVSNDIPSDFVQVGGGMYHNGTSWVSVSSFYMDKYELTQGEYFAVMGTDPAWEGGNGDNYPVYNVSWFNAIAYCNIRSTSEGLTPCYTMTGYGTNPSTWPPNWFNNYPIDSSISCDWTANGYRLPTEAEWEFAARGGSLSQGYTYSGSNDLNLVGWPSNGYPQNTHVVGGKAANELGLFDMSGNVWERCWDVTGNYPTGEQVNPHGPGGTGSHIFRGGGIQSPPAQCTVSARAADLPHILNYTIGFRICRIIQ